MIEFDPKQICFENLVNMLCIYVFFSVFPVFGETNPKMIRTLNASMYDPFKLLSSYMHHSF